MSPSAPERASPVRPRRPTVAVLGAGIMGSSIALDLARSGIDSVLLDAAPAPFAGASRFNEGKIHLGYLYLADPSLGTARKVIPGGLSFRRLLAELLDCPAAALACTGHDDTYLVHRRSVVDADSAFALAECVHALICQHPDADDYFVPLALARPRRLLPRELAERSGSPDIVAGFEVPERSVSTQRLAEIFVQALGACPRVEQRMGRRVRAVRRVEERGERWLVDTRGADGGREVLGPFDAVVNALWEGMPEVDATVGLRRSPTWTHRYRVSVFARTRAPVGWRSAVIAVGPFGDVKNYDGRNLYLSWYDSGLLLESHALRPPPPPLPDAQASARIIEEKLLRLGRLLPALEGLGAQLEQVELRGGWVYAAGHGALSDPRSRLHRRDDIGLRTRGSYFSVDTGKYSMAPFIAREVAEAVRSALGRGPPVTLGGSAPAPVRRGAQGA